MPDISAETIENVMNLLVDEIDSIKELVVDQEDLIKELMEYIEFLEEQQSSIENDNIKALAQKNMELKKALTFLEGLLQNGVKDSAG